MEVARLTQAHGDRLLVVNPPALPLDEPELDETSQGVAGKLKISPDTLPGIREAYDEHAQSMRQSVS